MIGTRQFLFALLGVVMVCVVHRLALDGTGTEAQAVVETTRDRLNRAAGSREPPPSPTGIFVCTGQGPTPDREVGMPFISGWLVRPGWDKVEPKDGRYDWRCIEDEIKTAKRLDKKITLTILGGPHAPTWLFDAGAKGFDYRFASRYRRNARDARMPIPWDEIFLARWTSLIRAAGDRFGSEERIELVHVTGATQNGLEMHLPFGKLNQRRWEEAGYTPRKMIASWKQIIDAYAEAFPNTPLDIDIHPVLGSCKVAEEVVAYGYGKLGKQFGVFGGWLNGKPAANDRRHARLHRIVEKYGKLSFADFQLIGNQTRQPERFADGKLESAINQGMRWGARYFEIWRIDAINPDLHPTLRTLAAKVQPRSDR